MSYWERLQRKQRKLGLGPRDNWPLRLGTVPPVPEATPEKPEGSVLTAEEALEPLARAREKRGARQAFPPRKHAYFWEWKPGENGPAAPVKSFSPEECRALEEEMRSAGRIR